MWDRVGVGVGVRVRVRVRVWVRVRVRHQVVGRHWPFPMASCAHGVGSAQAQAS